MQLGLPNGDSVFNDSLLHSTIQLIQFEFITEFKRQINFQVEGLSVKLFKSMMHKNEQGNLCMAQMSFPICFNYVIDDKSALVCIENSELVLFDVPSLIDFLTIGKKKEDSGLSQSSQQNDPLESIMKNLYKFLDNDLVDSVKFNLKSGSVKFVQSEQGGGKELTLSVTPIEFGITRTDLFYSGSKFTFSNLKVQDNESVIEFCISKCSVISKIERDKFSNKLHFELGVELSICSLEVRDAGINDFVQYFFDVYQSRKTTKICDASPQPLTSTLSPKKSFIQIYSKYFEKFIFALDINDVSFSTKYVDNIVTYGLKHLKTNCTGSLGASLKETRLV